ncbi:hypothetical protein SAMN05428967_2269 [Phyllobacterium sp. YR620]|nr:hypothetical protein SAMN05428967_2269 [Phyllobacterium sp. YR620]
MNLRSKPDITPRGLNRAQASGYAGISPSLFDILVRAGVMPQPIRWGGRLVYDRHAIDALFDRVKKEDEWEVAV